MIWKRMLALAAVLAALTLPLLLPGDAGAAPLPAESLELTATLQAEAAEEAAEEPAEAEAATLAPEAAAPSAPPSVATVPRAEHPGEAGRAILKPPPRTPDHA